MECPRWTLQENSYHAIPLKDVNKDGNHLHCERIAIRRYPIVIKLDVSDTDNPPKSGCVGESVLISFDRQSQEKTFLFLKDTEYNRKMVFGIKDYCLYFPRTYFCKDEADMLEKSTSIAIREVYRLAYLRYEELRVIANLTL